jgi:L-alanine-DL-glutamate epimerase-like enolase superfamily enzyme
LGEVIFLLQRSVITNFNVQSFTIPTERPLESDGTLEWTSTTLILVQLEADGVTGMGYTYGSRGLTSFAEQLLSKHVTGQNSLSINSIWENLRRAVRNDGHQGLSSMAISAIDNALWDLRARLFKLPLVDLLGHAREKVEIYGSGGFTSMTLPELKDQMSGWQKQGIKKFKMKVGTHPEQDSSRVHFVRECIGPNAALMVDANEAYDAGTALRLSQEFAKEDVSWFEQPLRDTNIEGLSELRRRLPAGMSLSTGEYIYDSTQALQFLRAKSADVIQLDVTRCGGVTGFLKAAALCEAFNVPISTHCAPSLHVALGCSIPTLKHLEFFSDHARIETMLFDGVRPVEDGYLQPDLNRHGFGLTLKNQDFKRWQ